MGTSQAPPITDVKGKVAYITGGSSGIGLGIARVFYEAGMKVVIGYLDEQHIGDALKHFPTDDPRVHAIKHDVMERDAWERVADEIEKKFGGLQVLVNNAGVGLQAPASTGTYKDWEWGLGVNLWGPIYGTHTYVPRMLASKQGAQIITTTSTSGILPGQRRRYLYRGENRRRGLHGGVAPGTAQHQYRDLLLRTGSDGDQHWRQRKLSTGGVEERWAAGPRPGRNAASRCGCRRCAASAAPAAGAPEGMAPAAVRPMDPMVAARFVLDGLLHNDLYIVAEPEYRAGVEARCNALLESMNPFKPLPASLTPPASVARTGVYRSPIYVQEIGHRRATQNRDLAGT